MFAQVLGSGSAVLGLVMVAQLPAEAGSSQAIGWVMVTIFAILGGLNQGLQVWQKMFPKPTPPLNEVYATKADVQALERDHDAELRRIEKRFEEWMTSADEARENDRKAADTWRDGITRALGRIEGKLDPRTRRG